MYPAAAIIVTHNSQDAVERCIASLGDTAEVVVVDNASTDGTADVLARSRAILLRNRTNRGFAAAVNQGAAVTQAPVLLVCNPDIEALEGLGRLCELAIEHGAAAGLLIDEAGPRASKYSARRFPQASTLCFEALGLNALWPGNPINRRYRYLDRDVADAGPVEQPPGAYVAIRRDIFDKVGGFDEQFYPVWFEDVDFFKRVTDAGCIPWYDPTVRARHTGAHSVGKLALRTKELYWYGSLLRYAKKYFPRQQFAAVCASVLVGCGLRAARRVFSGTDGDSIGAFRPVARLALGGLLTGQVEPARTGPDRASGRESHSSVSGRIQ